MEGLMISFNNQSFNFGVSQNGISWAMFALGHFLNCLMFAHLWVFDDEW